MDTKDVKRKLTAILSADVKGYSRLMGDDEQATVETITAYRKVMRTLFWVTMAGWWMPKGTTY